MFPALDLRPLFVALRIAAVCMLLATATFTGAPVRADDQSISTDVPGSPRLLENAAWFEQFLITQTESPSDAVVPRNPERQIRPAVDPPALPPSERPEESAAAAPQPDALDATETTNENAFTLFRRSRSRSSFARRRRPIAVLGDSLVDAGQLDIQFTAQDYTMWPPTPVMASASLDIPLIATATRTKVADNSSVTPTDRVFVSYQHFQNGRSAQVSNPDGGGAQRTLNVDRMSIGFEKTFFDGQWSFDIRLPVTSRFDVSAADFALTNGRLGNVSLLLKHVLFESDGISLGAGVGLDTPTGNDAQINLFNSQAIIGNDAFHALPYLGLLVAPTDRFLLQGFVQLDLPLNGNQIEAIESSGNRNIGSFDEQELLYLSLSAVQWHYQNPDATYLRGLAALFELHYTTSLDGSDQVSVAAGGDTYQFGNPASDIDILNMTAGMQAQIGMTDFRAAAVIPLLGGANKPFDAEFLLQINRNY